jgi:RimJ/RimL family protein N-acetyltransferase
MSFIEKIAEDLVVVEYKWYDGGWTLRDSFMIELYKRFRYKNRIFYNVKDLDNWNPLPYFRSVRLWVMLDNSGKALGAVWLSMYNNLNSSGFFSYGLCQNTFQDERDSIKLIHSGLKYILDREDIKIVFSEVSTCNTLALIILEYLGFKLIGTIPQAHYHIDEDRRWDTKMFYITKDLLEIKE